MMDISMPFLVIYGLMGALFLFVALKSVAEGDPANAWFWGLAAAAFGGDAIALLAAGACSWHENIVGALFIFPLGGMMGILGLRELVLYRRCTLAVRAQCEGRVTIYSGRGITWYAAKFFYWVEGENYTQRNFVLCSRKRWEALYRVDAFYTVHVDPHYPKRCADKRVFPRRAVGAMIFSAFPLLLSAALLISGIIKG